MFHVPSRGVGRQPLFGKHDDFEAFEKIVAETLDKYAMRIRADCLMPNHWRSGGHRATSSVASAGWTA